MKSHRCEYLVQQPPNTAELRAASSQIADTSQKRVPQSHSAVSLELNVQKDGLEGGSWKGALRE